MRAEMFFAQANNRVDTSQTRPGCLEFCVTGFTSTVFIEAQNASSATVRAIKERISAQCSASVFVLTDQKGVSLSDLFQTVDSDRFHSPQQERQRQNSSARWETLPLTGSLGQCMEHMVLPLPSVGMSFERLSTALATLTEDRKTHTVVYALAIVNCFDEPARFSSVDRYTDLAQDQAPEDHVQTRMVQTLTGASQATLYQRAQLREQTRRVVVNAGCTLAFLDESAETKKAIAPVLLCFGTNLDRASLCAAMVGGVRAKKESVTVNDLTQAELDLLAGYELDVNEAVVWENKRVAEWNAQAAADIAALHKVFA
jgi:hypothetical protein